MFEEAKRQLVSANVLTHYNPTLPINFAADASAYGIGAIVATAEKNYSQLEREALSLNFGVRKFHQYLYKSKFTLITDHKPLTAIFGSKKVIPSLAAACLQQWALLLFRL